jgi:hypothetical protein
VAVFRGFVRQTSRWRHFQIVDTVREFLIDIIIVEMARPTHDNAKVSVKNVGAPERSFAAL